MRRKLSEAIGRFSVFLGQACGVFYLAAIALSVYEVFTRYVLDTPTVWTTEVIMALCASAWLLSAAAVTQQNRHITVTVMELVVSRRTWAIMRRIGIVISIVAILGLLWASFTPSLRAIAHIERSGSAFNPPVPSYLKVMIMVALVLYVLQLFANLLKPDAPGSDDDVSGSRLPVDMKD